MSEKQFRKWKVVERDLLNRVTHYRIVDDESSIHVTEKEAVDEHNKAVDEIVRLTGVIKRVIGYLRIYPHEMVDRTLFSHDNIDLCAEILAEVIEEGSVSPEYVWKDGKQWYECRKCHRLASREPVMGDVPPRYCIACELDQAVEDSASEQGSKESDDRWAWKH